jgi:hypothetical protein
MTNDTAVERLNSVQYLYLRELSEPRDNSLRVVVEEAIVNHSRVLGSDMPEPRSILKDASPIESVECSKVFELRWQRCAAYLVTEELVGSNAVNGYDDECYTGRLLRVYSRSHFLDHIARDTGGHIEPLQHYKLICLNHLIDIAAYAPPETRLIGTVLDEEGKALIERESARRLVSLGGNMPELKRVPRRRAK